MSKIVIIGGGISSCVMALFLLKNKHQVEIYESRKTLGGILNDFKTDNQIFFRGCQYLDVENKWFKRFYNELKDELNVFHHTYGSYVEINGKKNFSKNFAVPCFDRINVKNIDTNKLLNSPKISMKNRFDLYPKNISNFFTNIIKRHKLDPYKLNFESAGSLQMSRITSESEIENLSELKTKNKLFDDIFALKRSMIYKNETELKAALPKSGFTKLFEVLRTKLINYGAKIYTKTIVKPTWHEDKLKIEAFGKSIDNDYVIWTGDPTKLIKSSIDKDIESENLKILQTDANLKETENYEDIYIQVFSDEKNLTKIYLYKIDNVKKISVESMNIKSSPVEILAQAKEILKNFNINVNFENSNIHQKVDVRFNIVTINDENTIKNFLNKTKNSNLLPGHG